MSDALVSADGTIILGDWDHVAVGPPEWGLAQIYYTRKRLGYPQSEDVDGFGIAYGGDPRDWPGLATLVAIREVSGLSTYIRNAPPSHSPGESSPCGLARSKPAITPPAGTAPAPRDRGRAAARRLEGPQRGEADLLHVATATFQLIR
jgi:hypothetical protein